MDGELAGELLGAGLVGVDHVVEAEVTVLEAEDGDARRVADGEIAELFVLDLVGGMRGHLGDDLRNGLAEGEHLVGDVELVFHSSVHASDVQVGGDGVGDEAGLDERCGNRPLEGAAAVVEVEEDAALAADEHAG